MIANDRVCVACRAGAHARCEGLEDLIAEHYCCCDGQYSIAEHLREMLGLDPEGIETPTKAKGTIITFADAPKEEKSRGDSGYIHPDAWGSTANIGTLKDVASTGHKRAARMYPIEPGMVCEWARLQDCGGGVRPVVGCMGAPASDVHHGPDKNTLNNSKASRGVGWAENVWLLCSDCHNSWHAANDEFFPEYDRDEQQTEPWLPFSEEPWGPQTPSPAAFEDLVAEEQRREKRRTDRGRTTRGRNSQPRLDADTSIDDDADGE